MMPQVMVQRRYLTVDGMRAPVRDILESLVVLRGGGMQEAGEEHSSITNVNTTDSLSIDEFPKNLSIVVANLFFKVEMLSSAFSGTNEANQSLGEVWGKGH